jgi:RHS repeat-associated protein
MYDEKGTTQFGNTVRNGIGRLTSSWEAWGGQGFSYDEMGRPLTVRRVVEHAADFLYTYNIDGSVTSLQYPSGRVVNYAYDAAGHALSATDSNGTRYVSNATYWPNGAEFQRSMPNIYFSTSLNKRLQVSALYSDNGVVSNYYLNKTYDYGAQNNGNVLSIANNKDPNRTQTFTYDNLNRLISAQNAGTDCSEVLLDGHTKYWGNSYGYDPWGNLINKTITKCGAEHLQAQALASNQLADYGYDSAGNMTQDLTSGMQYHYDAGNMLKTVGSITYWYDNDGQRYIKWNNGVPVKSYFYGSDGEILAEGSGGSTLTAEYIFFNGKRLARVDLPGNAVHYYLSDALNTTSMEVNSAGVIENESDYYPWGGELKFTVNDPGNPYKFTGKERDTETGLDYFGARYYSNGLGRFSTPDWSSTPVPVPYADITDPQSLNQYSYVRNIPTSDVDSDGHDGCCKTLPEPTEADWKLIDQAGRGGIEISLSAMAAGAALVFGPVMIKPDILPGGTVGQSDSDEQAQIQQASQERAAQNGGVDPQAEPEPAAASAAPPMKGNGRGGKQDRLNQLGNDDKQSSSDRGWIKQDQNAINRGQRTTVRVPPGKQMAHARGREAAKGYNHKTSPSSLQNIRNHRTQHKYDGHGKKNKERN